MTLSEVTPKTITSALQRHRLLEAPLWIVIGLICVPALVFHWPYLWLISLLAVAAGMAVNFGLSNWRHRRRVKRAMTPPESFPEPPKFDVGLRAERWRTLVAGTPTVSFVLFSYGTCVVFGERSSDPVGEARALLRRFGPAIPGTSSGDMLIYRLPDTNDFIIGGHHPNILTYVPREFFPPNAEVEDFELGAAYLGRDLRVLDSFALNSIGEYEARCSSDSRG